jgi:tripartite-type tricarboxylate transporter receptor subunit TctC
MQDNGPTELTRRGAFGLLASLAPAAAFAAPYPERPVRLIVPLAPGGPADTSARVFAPYFSAALGQNVLVENRPGASAVIGTESVVRAAPDGYTVLFGSSSTFAINPAVMKNLRFDAHKELRLIGLVCYTPHVLVVRASVPAQTFPELVRLAKAQPDALIYASSGNGGAIHLASELVKREAGIDLRHLPYRGGGPAVLGLLAGDAQVFINDVSTTIQHIRNGRLRPLAMAWTARSPQLPDVPTFAEVGFPAVISTSWFGLAAPAATPADVIARLDQAMRQAFSASEYQAALKHIGFEQFILDADQSMAFIKREIDKWSAVAKSANIQID